MKSNKMFVALVAMLWSFTLSANNVKVANLAELQDALAAGGEVVLDADITVSEIIEVPAGVTATLDLNGKAITVPEAEKRIYALNNKGVLTIKDTKGNGSISARGIYNGWDGISSDNTVEGAKLIVEGGKFVALDIDGGAAILNCAELIINGGTFEGIYAAINNRAKGVATINGGTYAGCYDDGKSRNYIILNNGGSLTINDATVISGFGAVGCYSGTTIINGGNFLPTGWEGYTSHVVYVAGAADVTINGGTFKMNYPADKVPDSGSAVASYYNGKLSITGGTFYAHFDNVSPVELSAGSEITGGSYYNHAGVASTHSYVTNFVKKGYTLGEDGKVVSTYAAMIGTTPYETLQAAIEAVQEGEIITLVNDVNVTTPAYGQNALNHTRAISFTLDLNRKKLSADTGNSVFRFNITNSGATSNVTLNIINGTITAGSNTWCAVMAAGISANVKAIMNLENLTIEGSKAGDLAVKSWDNAIIKAKNVTVNTTNAAGGFYAVGGEIVLDECTVNQKGLHTEPYLSMAFAVSTKGKMTINSGTYSAEPTAAAEGNNQGTSHGSWVGGVMNSGGELIINGGTFSNDNFGENSLATAARGAILADTKAKVEIYGGTFNVLKNVIDIQNNLGDANNNPSVLLVGGTYSADPRISAQYGSNLITLAEDCIVKEENNRFIVVKEGLEGEGTEANPYLIKTVEDLILFRNSVNAGETKYNAEGVYVALGANIDLAGQDWSVNIGDDCNATFDGIFDGKGFTISNLTSTETREKADGYICTGLFGAIAGNAVVKNFTIENVSINTGEFTGNNVGAVVGFALSASGSIEDVTVTGNININASNVTAVGAILGYDYYSPALKVKNCKVIGSEGSSIVGGAAYVGGLVGYASNKIAMNGNTVENVTVTGTASVGAIAGIMLAGGSAAGNTVKNVSVEATKELWYNSAAVVAGTMTSNGTVTISNTTVENVTINDTKFDDNEEDAYASVIVGGIHATKPTSPIAKVEAKIDDTYYATFDAAMAAQGDDDDNVELLVEKAITLDDSNAYTYTKGAYDVDVEYTRTLIAGIWNPLYIPFDATVLAEEFEVAKFTTAEGTTITLEKLEANEYGDIELSANTAYVVRPIDGNNPLSLSAWGYIYSNKEVSPQPLGNEGFSVRGNYNVLTGAKLADTDRVVGSNGNWGKLNTASTLKPYRLILSVPENFSAEQNAISFSMRVLDNTTGVEETIFDGQETIVIFDLMGRRVESITEGGIYIVNGKKMIF